MNVADWLIQLVCKAAISGRKMPMSVVSWCIFLPVRVAHNSRLQPHNAPPPIRMELMSHFLCSSNYRDAWTGVLPASTRPVWYHCLSSRTGAKAHLNPSKNILTAFPSHYFELIKFSRPSIKCEACIYILVCIKHWCSSSALNCLNALWADLDYENYFENTKRNSECSYLLFAIWADSYPATHS
jgi:hypothetical protein